MFWKVHWENPDHISKSFLLLLKPTFWKTLVYTYKWEKTPGDSYDPFEHVLLREDPCGQLSNARGRQEQHNPTHETEWTMDILYDWQN